MGVTAIVPAYNEEKTISAVLQTISNVKEVDRIIVVSDGSTDSTAEIAREENVEVVDLKKNLGKGGAVKTGLDMADTDIILLLDADLVGLSSTHVRTLLEPVLSGRADMSVGLFDSGRGITDLAQKVAPFLSGQRALKKKIFDNLSEVDISRFGVEFTLHHYAEETSLKVEEVVLKDLTHVMKEEKLGFFKGSAARIKMYWEILMSIVKANNPME